MTEQEVNTHKVESVEPVANTQEEAPKRRMGIILPVTLLGAIIFAGILLYAIYGA